MMDRRDFLTTATALGLSSGVASASPSPGDQRRLVTSEVGPLKKVIMHPPGAETRKTFPMLLGGHSMLTWELLREQAREQHAAFVEVLEKSGAEVLLVEQLIDEALEEARREKSLQDWLETAAPQLADHKGGITSATLLGRDDQLVYRTDENGTFRPLTDPLATMFFTRDIAVATPRGMVLCNFNNKLRRFESTLARFVFQHAPRLRPYPVVFDAVKEQVHVQGGDVMVVDENTLLVGIGNSTTENAAVKLAQKLEMDVITVQMPSVDWQAGEWDGLQLIFYHLDCLFNFVDRRTILAVPYLLEKQHVDRNPLLEVLYGLARLDAADRTEIRAMLTEVRDVGWLKRFKAGSGQRDAAFGDVKLVDYLKDNGYAVIYVGGQQQPGQNVHKHLVERVVRECRFMAVNLFAVAPRRVICYQGNPHTLAALQQAKIDVTTFPSHELVRANGGPHCLTMPLERG